MARWLIKSYECRNVTFMESDGSWPIIWNRAKGVHVWDEAGKKYLDLTAAFGVAASGHANPLIVHEATEQMKRLLHAMGDVHPHMLKGKLAQELSAITFEYWHHYKTNPYKKWSGNSSPESWFATGKTIFCNSGFEAVEAALKTALLATRKAGIIAFKGGYHGLGYGALNATHRKHFRRPFYSQLAKFGRFVTFPTRPNQLRRSEATIRRQLRSRRIGAVLVEPIQVRGGIRIPPREFLSMLRRLCDEHNALLIFDEIFTGFGRTGEMFACGITPPDIVCLGKALTGGFPLSACVGRSDVMDAAWPPATGEAIHTSTFAGHPVGCAMALAQLEILKRESAKKPSLVHRSYQSGEYLLRSLQRLANPKGLRLEARGRGLLVGLEICLPDGSPATAVTMHIIKKMLHRGFILLPEGEHSNVISFTPPLKITKRQLGSMVSNLKQVILESLVP